MSSTAAAPGIPSDEQPVSPAATPRSLRKQGSARPESSDSTHRRQLARQIGLIGIWQGLLGIMALAATAVSWSWIEQVSSSTPRTIGWGGLEVTMTVTSGALVIGALGGLAGSLVHTITIFSSRVGRRTYEASYLFWYLLRPIGAALLAVLFVAAVYSGLLAMNNAQTSSPTVAFVLGGLAGLFTDSVLQKLRGLLGATSTEHRASKQPVPLAPPPAPPLADDQPQPDNDVAAGKGAGSKPSARARGSARVSNLPETNGKQPR